MPAELWKSLTGRIMAPGHPLREAVCRAAAIVIDCLAMYTIMGYRFRDAERERPAASWYGPWARSMTRPGNCGTVLECVDRDGIFFHCQLNPARPGRWEEWNGIADRLGISSPAIVQDTALVCW